MARECKKCGNSFDPRPHQQICDACQPVCSAEGCVRAARRRGLCFGHLKGTYREYSDGICKIDGCEKPVNDLGMCSMHALRFRKYGDPGPHQRQRRESGPCSVRGCANRAKASGLCGMHYMRLRTDGYVGEATRRRAKSGEGSTNRDGYRIIRRNGEACFEHRAVMEDMLGRPLRPDEQVHHRNGRRADNRDTNLELWIVRQPPGQRVEDVVTYALSVLKDYPELLARRGMRLMALESADATEELIKDNFGRSHVFGGLMSFGA